MRLFPSRKATSASHPEPDRHRILTECILHMSITCLGDEDVTPLYEEYMKDLRLGNSEKEVLTEAYHSLHPRTPSAISI